MAWVTVLEAESWFPWDHTLHPLPFPLGVVAPSPPAALSCGHTCVTTLSSVPLANYPPRNCSGDSSQGQKGRSAPERHKGLAWVAGELPYSPPFKPIAACFLVLQLRAPPN